MTTADIKDVSMTYSSALEIAKAIDDKRLDFNGMRGTLDNLVDTLNGQWEGAAQREFLTAYNKLKPKLKLISKVLEEYSAAIRTAVTNEQEQEKHAAGLFSRLNDPLASTPFAPETAAAPVFATKTSRFDEATVSTGPIIQKNEAELPPLPLPTIWDLYYQPQAESGEKDWTDTFLEQLPDWLRKDIYKFIGVLPYGDGANAYVQLISDISTNKFSWDSLDRYYDILEKYLDSPDPNNLDSNGSIIVQTLKTVTAPKGTMKELMDGEAKYKEKAIHAFQDGDIGGGFLKLGQSFLSGLGAIGYGVIEVPSELVSSSVGTVGDIAYLGTDVLGHIIPGSGGSVLRRGAQRTETLTGTITDWISNLL